MVCVVRWGGGVCGEKGWGGGVCGEKGWECVVRLVCCKVGGVWGVVCI